MLYEVGMKRSGSSLATKGYKSVDVDGDGVTDKAVVDTDQAAPRWAEATIARAKVAWAALLEPRAYRTAAQQAALAGQRSNALVTDEDMMQWRRDGGVRLPYPFDTKDNVIAVARGDKAAWKKLGGSLPQAFWEAVTDGGQTPWSAAGYERIDPEPGPIAIPDGLFPPKTSSSAPPWLPVAVGAGAVGLVLLAAAWKRSRKGRR